MYDEWHLRERSPTRHSTTALRWTSQAQVEAVKITVASECKTLAKAGALGAIVEPDHTNSTGHPNSAHKTSLQDHVSDETVPKA
jgi:hypothetical protein